MIGKVAQEFRKLKVSHKICYSQHVYLLEPLKQSTNFVRANPL